MTPPTMVPVMLSSGFMLASIAGLVASESPCAPPLEAPGERPAILRRESTEIPCAAGGSIALDLQPQALAVAHFVDVGELIRMCLELFPARTHHGNGAGPSTPQYAT